MKIKINIRNVDNTVYRRFRGRCVELNKTTGEAMTEAIEIWLNKHQFGYGINLGNSRTEEIKYMEQRGEYENNGRRS